MIINRMYYGTVVSKSGHILPCLQNNKTLESKYDTLRDVERYYNAYVSELTDFYIILGISSALLIDKICSNFQNCIVIAVENTVQDLEFLESIESINQIIKKHKNIILSDISTLATKLKDFYNPIKYKSLKIIENQSWIIENKDLAPFIKSQINNSLNDIANDIATQQHFGKIWQNNILKNLLLLSSQKSINKNEQINFPINKTAYIIAAGPSLDSKISMLKKQQSINFIISTDTAYPILLKNNIHVDVVISIDAQYISSNHFLQKSENTIFLFDICSNFSAHKKFSNPNQVFFYTSSHPLEQVLKLYNNDFIFLETNSGTVTIVALDFAVKAGFKNIKILGADFAYLNRKPYAKGSYLDNRYFIQQNRVFNNEIQFIKLMYRSKTTTENKIIYTPQLNNYKKNLLNYLETHQCSYSYDQNIYNIQNNNQNHIKFLYTSINFSDFINFYKNLNKNIYQTTLLPYIYHLSKKTENIKKDFDELENVAWSTFVRYN